MSSRPVAAAVSKEPRHRVYRADFEPVTVKAIEPHSEADPVALLMQFLTMAGNLIGRTAYYRVEDDRHHANLFAMLVGESSKARKGTSIERVRSVAKIADQGWSDDRLKGGLSSGEGLINEVRDERREWTEKKGGRKSLIPASQTSG
jgi:hypothetical protein